MFLICTCSRAAAEDVEGDTASLPGCVINYVYYKEKSASLQVDKKPPDEAALNLFRRQHFPLSLISNKASPGLFPSGWRSNQMGVFDPSASLSCRTLARSVCVWESGEGGFNSCRGEKPCFIEKEIGEASCKIAGDVWSIREEEPYFLPNLRRCDVSGWACAGDPELMSTTGQRSNGGRLSSLQLARAYFDYKSVATMKMKPAELLQLTSTQTGTSPAENQISQFKSGLQIKRFLASTRKLPNFTHTGAQCCPASFKKMLIVSVGSSDCLHPHGTVPK